MKRLFGLLLAGTLVAAMPLAACANNTAAPASTGTEGTAAEGTAETGVTQAEIESKIIGTWVVADEDGKPAPTNDKLAYDFVSLGKAKVYASLDTPLEGTSGFLNAVEADFVLDGNTLTVTEHPSENETVKNVFTVSSISDSEFSADYKAIHEVDGGVKDSYTSTVRCVKPDVGYQDAVLGTWEDRAKIVAGEPSDKFEPHRRQFKADGTYDYYTTQDNELVLAEDGQGEYCVAGNLLCQHWVEGGEDRNAVWDIEIDGDTMTLHALRRHKDGGTYEVAFELAKVE